ncbi:MAG TPA: alpha/beta hydrolase [Holophaga sp.]|jgi:acetyl esterase/lipase|nr:alpha/beta hydrolase [Holophaga sp.]
MKRRFLNTYILAMGLGASVLAFSQPGPMPGAAGKKPRRFGPLPFAKHVAPHDMSTSQLLDVAGSPDVSALPSDVKLTTYKDIVYSKVKTIDGDPLDLKMDVFAPEQAKKLPLVVFVTGGGFMMSPKGSNAGARAYLAKAGYVVASIEYRVVPQGLYSDAVGDVKSAIRFLRANADRYGIDTSKVAVWGDSAGGYMTAMVGTTNGVKKFEVGDNLDQSSAVLAGVDFYGLSDLTRIAMDYDQAAQDGHNTPNISEAMYVNGPDSGKSIRDDLQAAAQANPLTYVDKSDPALLFIHGSEDALVSPSQTLLVHNALRAAGVPSTRYVIKGANHGGPQWSTKMVMDIVVSYFDKMLKK